jgi:hypothetical protein
MYSQVSVQTHMQTLMHMQMHMRSHFDLKCVLLFAVVQQCASNMASMGSYLIRPYSFEPVLPQGATKEQISEALQLWDVPIEAYPHAKRWDVNYIVKSPPDLPDLPQIHVHLLRQCFVTKPNTQRHSYFSFFATGEFPIGPVDNPIPPGQNVPHRGYNHSNAKAAFGEAQILAGWKTEVFALEWFQQFNVHKQPCQPFPYILKDFILDRYPKLYALITQRALRRDVLYCSPRALMDIEQRSHGEHRAQSSQGAESAHPDAAEPENQFEDCFQIQLVQQDHLHTVDHGVAARYNEECVQSYLKLDEVASVASGVLHMEKKNEWWCCKWLGNTVSNVQVGESCANEEDVEEELEKLEEAAGGELASGDCKIEEINEEMCSESSVGTYEDPELIGPHSEWVVIGRE